MDRNPQAEQMASDAMVRTLAAQADAIWPLEAPLFDRYPVPEGGLILDVGCGTGAVTQRIATRFPRARVLGVDVHEPHLERARAAAAHLPNLSYRRDDAFALKLEDASVHLACCRHVHQSIPEPELAIRELFRVLRPGGWAHLLLEDYGMMHFAGTALDADRFWREGPWTFAASIDNDLRIGRKGLPLLRAAGFEQVGVHYLPVDTLRTDRATFAAIWQAWAEGYTEPVARHTGLGLDEVRAHWADMIAAIRNPEAYALWQVPIWAGRRPE